MQLLGSYCTEEFEPHAILHGKFDNKTKESEDGTHLYYPTHLEQGHCVTYVADNSLPATRRAEWCIRNPDCILVDGLFVL